MGTKLGSQELIVALENPIIVGHNNFLEPMLLLIMRINVEHINYKTTLNF